jgi:hypothetical protein
MLPALSGAMALRQIVRTALIFKAYYVAKSNANIRFVIHGKWVEK